MSPKTILFTGAPHPRSITQDPEGLISHFAPPISTYLGITKSQEASPALPEAAAAWRSLGLKRRRLETGLSQLHAFPDLPQDKLFRPDTNFFTTANISFASTTGLESQDASILQSQDYTRQRILSQFYDHSLAQHQELHSSQVAGSSVQDGSSGSCTDETTSFLTDSRSFTSTRDQTDVSLLPPVGNKAASSHLSDLEDIPSAAKLLALAPATVTVNLIAGIISIAQPRTVVTRWGRNMSLIEILLGDETRAGFAVTFWLPPSPQITDGPPNANNNNNAPVSRPAGNAHVLASLRRQDVVLLQNVALNVFMGKVYGQSLRRDTTKVHLLHRRKLDRDDEGGYYRPEDLSSRKRPVVHPQLEKTKRVRDWVLRFVGAGEDAGRQSRMTRSSTRKRAWDRPPDDTQ